MHDLILRGGRIIDPAEGRDEVADVAFIGDKVSAVGTITDPRLIRSATWPARSSCRG